MEAPDQENPCAICLGGMAAGGGQATFTAECSHTFHFNCISASVAHGHLVCPLCNARWRELPFLLPTAPVPPTLPTLGRPTPMHAVQPPNEPTSSPPLILGMPPFPAQVPPPPHGHIMQHHQPPPNVHVVQHHQPPDIVVAALAHAATSPATASAATARAFLATATTDIVVAALAHAVTSAAATRAYLAGSATICSFDDDEQVGPASGPPADNQSPAAASNEAVVVKTHSEYQAIARDSSSDNFAVLVQVQAPGMTDVTTADGDTPC